MKTKTHASSGLAKRPNVLHDETGWKQQPRTQQTPAEAPAYRAPPLSAEGGNLPFRVNDLLSTSSWDVSQSLSAGLLTEIKLKLHIPLKQISKEAEAHKSAPSVRSAVKSCCTVNRRSTRRGGGGGGAVPPFCLFCQRSSASTSRLRR